MRLSILFLLIIEIMTGCSSSSDTNNNQTAIGHAPVTYRLAVVKRTGVASVVKLPAQMAAYQEVSIFPKVNAYVKTVSVDIGDKVSRGQVLMTLEAPELQQATLQAREKYARARSDFSIDREHYQRLLEAAHTPGAISALDLSMIRAKMNADSALSNAEKSNWQMQIEMQTYLTVRAPFSGVITERNVYPGALVSTMVKDKPMLELKEVAKLRLQADIPEALATTLSVGDTVSFYTSALPGRRMTGIVNRKSMNVNPRFRSERMEIDVENSKALLSPGMYADLIVYSKGSSSAFMVPSSSVITSTERKFVWAVREGRAVKVDVTTGNTSAANTEVYGDLAEGQSVIAAPGDDLKEGNAVR